MLYQLLMSLRLCERTNTRKEERRSTNYIRRYTIFWVCFLCAYNDQYIRYHIWIMARQQKRTSDSQGNDHMQTILRFVALRVKDASPPYFHQRVHGYNLCVSSICFSFMSRYIRFSLFNSLVYHKEIQNWKKEGTLKRSKWNM